MAKNVKQRYGRKRFFRRWRKKGRTNAPRVGRPSKALTLSRYFFKRKVTGLVNFSTIQEGGTTPTGMSSGLNKFYNVPADLGAIGAVVLWRFRLVDLPDNSEFTSGLFQYYRINGIKIRIIPQITQATLTTNTPQITTYTMPYDMKLEDEGASLSEAKVLQIQAAKTTQLLNDGNGKTFYCKSRLTNDLDAGALTDTRNWVGAKWLPATAAKGANEVPHYGLMQRYQPNMITNVWPTNMTVKVIATLYLEFKGVA